MVHEGGFAGVHGPQSVHLLVSELEVPDVEVLAHALAVGGLGDDDDPVLNQEAQGYLGCGTAVRLSDLGQGLVGEHPLASLGEGSPGFDPGAVLVHVGAFLGALVEDVGLQLVDGRDDSVELDQVHIAVGIEVRDSDGPQYTFFMDSSTEALVLSYP